RVGKMFNLAAAPICPGMVQKIRKTPADVVHIHYPNPTAIMAYLVSGHRSRLIIGYHSDIIRQKVLGKWFAPILHKALARSSALISNSPNLIESSDILSRYRDRCHVIPYGVRLKQFEYYDTAAVSRVREQFGPRIILSVGRLVSYKGYRYLIRAMEKVEGRLLLIGEGQLHGELQKQIAECGLGERIKLMGEIEDLLPFYHAADVFVLPSIARSEAFGIVQVEAMACGKPVVNTALASGVPFVSVHGSTGLTVPPADSDALATAISLLLDDSDLRARYGQAAKGRVQHEFSLDGMVERTFELYKHVLGTHRVAVGSWCPNRATG
ncbi:MAG: glycosyltransferase, partial [Acidobacteriota bacterium]|nr:glycosyltransferase [Acidobacteriota bacterium]